MSYLSRAVFDSFAVPLLRDEGNAVGVDNPTLEVLDADEGNAVINVLLRTDVEDPLLKCRRHLAERHYLGILI